MYIGRWVPVTVTSGEEVLRQIHEFVESFRMLSGSVPADDMVAITEKRILQMLKSASLRLEVITAFIDAHQHLANKNQDRLQASARHLVLLLAQEGIGNDDEQSASGTADTHNNNSKPSNVSQKRFGGAQQASVSFYEDPQEKAEATEAKEESKSAMLGDDTSGFTSQTGPATTIGEESMYLQQLKTREEALRYKLQFSTEREQEVLQRLVAVEQENLRLERAILEISESRERMKGLVEEQVYTQSLHTRIMGLLHLERNRNLDSRITRGVMFWCATFLFVLYSWVTFLHPVVEMYAVLRMSSTRSMPQFAAFFLDGCIASAIMAAVHEWGSYAIHDLCHGASRWLLVTLSQAAEENESSRGDEVRTPTSSALGVA